MRLARHHILIALAFVLGSSMAEHSQAEILDLSQTNTTDFAMGDPFYDTNSYLRTTDGGQMFLTTTENVGSSGTGLINTYLRVQNGFEEQGYSSDRTTAIFDEGVSQTTSLDASLVSTFTYQGTEYGEFLLDQNQTLLQLNQVQIFATTEAIATSLGLTPTNIVDADPSPNKEDWTVTTFVGGDYPVVEFSGNPDIIEVFRMSDITTQYTIEIPQSQAGSGVYDMRLFVEWTDFALLYDMGYTHLIFYSQFGQPPGTVPTVGGFEEWSTARDDLASIPEPSTWALLLMTAAGAVFFQYRRQRKQQLATTAEATDC